MTNDTGTSGVERFREWLGEKKEEARQEYQESAPRSENPRETDIKLGKFRAYRDAHRELLERTEDTED